MCGLTSLRPVHHTIHLHCAVSEHLQATLQVACMVGVVVMVLGFLAQVCALECPGTGMCSRCIWRVYVALMWGRISRQYSVRVVECGCVLALGVRRQGGAGPRRPGGQSERHQRGQPALCRILLLI